MSLVSYLSGASGSASLLRDCASGAVLIAAVWIAFRLFPRIPAAARCMVWWLLCLKMLTGLVWLAAPVKLAVLPANPAVIKPSQGSTLPRLPMREDLKFQAPTSPGPSLGKEGDRNLAPITQAPPASGGGGGSIPSWTLIRTLWLGGVGLFLMLLLGQFIRAAQMRRDAQAAPPGRCWEIMTAAAKALGVTPRPHVLVSLTTPLPMTAGLFRPVVLLPGKDAFTLTDDEMLMVLAHETAHIRRRDLWFGLIPALAQAVFFFHPLVWLAHREYLLAREEACDALALRASNLPADNYGRLLLRFGTMRGGAAAAVAISGAQAVHALRRRLAMLSGATVLTGRQRWAWTAGLSVFGILCVTPVALTERAAQLAPASDSRPVMTSSHVAPASLIRAVQVAQADLPVMTARAMPRLAQTPLEIHEIPQEIAVRPAPSRKHARSRENDLLPVLPPIPPMHVNVPPIPPLPPMHIRIPAFTVNVPAVHVSIPDINVLTPAIPAFPGVHVSGRGFKEFRMSPSEWARLRREVQAESKRDPSLLAFPGVHNSTQGFKEFQMSPTDLARLRQEMQTESKRDRDDEMRDTQEALREAQQDAAEEREEAKQDAAEAGQEARQDEADSRQEVLDAQREARQDAAEGMQSAHESLAEAEAELRQELHDNTNGVARQALQQALTCLEKSRKALPKSHGDR